MDPIFDQWDQYQAQDKGTPKMKVLYGDDLVVFVLHHVHVTTLLMHLFVTKQHFREILS